MLSILESIVSNSEIVCNSINGELRGQKIQDGDKFILNNPVKDVNSVTPSTASRTLYPLSIPSGVRVSATIVATGYTPNQGATFYGVFTSPLLSDIDPAVSWDFYITTTGTSLPVASYDGNILTNTGQIGMRFSNNTALGITVNTKGWIDRRGK